MVDTKEARAVKDVRLRWTARVIFILWALFWLYFNIGSGIGETAQHGAGSMLGHFGVAAIILAAALIAWFYEGIGGILLILLGLAAGYFLVMPNSRWASFTVPTLVLPPVVAGVLLVVNHWVVRKPRA